MADIPTFSDIFDAGRNEILRNPTRFNPEVVDLSGSDVNVVTATGASMADEVAGFAQQAFNELSLSVAAREGDEILERFLWDRYQLTKQSSQNAVVSVDFTRTDKSAALLIPAETVVSTDDGVTFSTVADLTLSVSIGTLSVSATADVSGVGGNVDIGAITTIVTQLTGAATLTATNSEVAAGGAPEETDQAFTDRGRSFFVSARRGTRQAIFNGAVGTAGVETANVIEDLDPNGDPTFRVQVIVSDQDGNANTALAQAVSDNLDEFRGLGVPVQVIAGTPEFVNIELENITFAATTNTSVLVDEMRARILAAVNDLAPGQTLERTLITTAAKFSAQVSVPDGALVEPVGDLVPTATNGVIRTTGARISINGVTGT